MTTPIDRFLSYCERTGGRPEKANIDGKTYIVEWHPNKMFKRIYPQPLSLEEAMIFYVSNVMLKGTSAQNNKIWKKK